MPFCDHCLRNVPGVEDGGTICCGTCGKLLQDCIFSEEATFVKTGGQSKLSGNYVNAVQNEFSGSRQRTLDRAFDYMSNLGRNLGVDDDSVSAQALAFYKIGLERNFTKGRRSELVQASCLYIAFRQKNKPYFLIDFSVMLRINLYILGAVFLQLAKLLRLENHSFLGKNTDPSLYIYKYVNNLLKQRNVAVCETALNVLFNMKSNWIQTGRKPNGVCAAALYIAANAHGFKCSKDDVRKVAYICEETLNKRLDEFGNTASSNLTIDELNAMAKEYENNPIKIPNGELNKCNSKELMCEHKGTGMPYFANGLCETCFKDFHTLSGGLDGGMDPPAFQRAERDRMLKSHSEENAKKSDDLAKDLNDAFESQIELHASEPESIGGNEKYVATKDGEHDKSHIENGMDAKTQDESETLSDIDDQEIDDYLGDEKEIYFKTKIWEFCNREYLEEQAIKEAAIAAEIKKREALFKNSSPESRAAMELAASAAEAVAKSRKEMRKKRAQEEKSLGPAQSAVEATSRMLQKKRLSSKVNLDRLDKLFGEPGTPENTKKTRFELPSDNDDGLEFKSEHNIKKDKLGPVDDFLDGDMDGEDDNSYYPENGYDTFDYEEEGPIYESIY